MTNRKSPVWVRYFLQSLERLGEVRAAAAEAGVDFTTAYARRRVRADFAAEWAVALERFRVARDAARAGEMGGVVAGLEAVSGKQALSPLAFGESPSIVRGRGAGAVHLPGAAKIVKESSGRWSKKVERAFLVELAVSANVRRACRAAGLSTTALYNRRMMDAHFASAWDAAVEMGKCRVQTFLVEAAGRTFDPDSVPPDETSVLPKVSVSEAIHIARLKGPPAPAAAKSPEPGEPIYEPYDIDEVRARLEAKMRKMGIPVTEEELAESGWWEANGELMPPGTGPIAAIRVADGADAVDEPYAERCCPRCATPIVLSFPRPMTGGGVVAGEGGLPALRSR